MAKPGQMKISRNGFAVFPEDSWYENSPDPAAAELWARKGNRCEAAPAETGSTASRLVRIQTRPVEVGHRSITICHLANIATGTRPRAAMGSRRRDVSRRRGSLQAAGPTTPSRLGATGYFLTKELD